jgi:hypothetical protein
MLALTTAPPRLASTLLTDIFAGRSMLSPFVLIAHGDKVSEFEKLALFGFTAFAAATDNATLGCARPLLPRLDLRGSSCAAGSDRSVDGADISGKISWRGGRTDDLSLSP